MDKTDLSLILSALTLFLALKLSPAAALGLLVAILVIAALNGPGP